MKLEKLSRSLEEAKSSVAFFTAIFAHIKRNPRYSLRIKDASVQRAVFFGADYSEKLARVILESWKSPEFFKDLIELRFVATRISGDLAAEFKRLNPRLLVIWVSSKEWRHRPVGDPDPVELDEDASVFAKSIIQ